jgi:CAAX prenyl protease-like protein
VNASGEDSSSRVGTPAAHDRGEPPVWPYVLPLAGFLALTALEGYLPGSTGGAPSPVWYPLGYAAKLAAVCGLIWVSRQALADLRPLPSIGGAVLAVGLGLLVTAAWVGLDGLYPEFGWLGRRTAFDPAAMPRPARFAFLAVRMFGLVAVVPLIEEIFYRSFLMRWIVDPDYNRVPIGRVTARGLGVTTAVFGLSHPEWLPAVLTGLAWGWLVGRTRSVSACVLSHATANLALGVYVLVNGAWKYW